MKKNKLNIAILFDSSNFWMKKYLDLLKADYIDLCIDKLKKRYDFVFLLGYTKKISKEELSRHGKVFLVHESDLPKGKGFAPIQWQILNNESVIYFCLIEAAEKIDSGYIYLKERLVLDGNELYDDIRLKQAKLSFTMIKRYLKNYQKIKGIPQKKYKTKLFKRRTTSDSELNINKTIKSQFNLLRIVNNDLWPAFFVINGQKYYLKITKDK